MFMHRIFRRSAPGFALGLGLLLASALSPVWGATFSGVTYEVEFRGNWSAETHPTGLPDNPHFSSLVGGVHNDWVRLWQRGEMASPGLETLAETGMPALFKKEVVGGGEYVGAVVQHLPPTSGTGAASFPLSVSEDFPLVTLVARIAPSPDWFVGVSGFNLMDTQGNWRDSHRIELFPHDAGTEDGAMFSTDHAATMPQGTIMSARGRPPFSDQPIATLTFTRTGEEDIQATVEQPMEDQVATGIGLIRGWAFGAASPVETIELLIDGESQGMIPIGSRRGDVGAAYPDNKYAADSGFGLTMNYGALPPGEHVLTIQVTTEMGTTFLIRRKITTRRFGGFAYVDTDLSEASASMDGEIIVIEGVQVMDRTDPTMMEEQTISLQWSKASQGFVIRDITAPMP